jgi:DNA-directed RNA polymerase specialized sigma24 family protein
VEKAGWQPPESDRIIVQDTCVHALRAADRFAPGTNLRVWLRIILANLARNRRRDLALARVQANEDVLARAAVSSVAVETSPEQRLLSTVMYVGPNLRRA